MRFDGSIMVRDKKKQLFYDEVTMALHFSFPLFFLYLFIFHYIFFLFIYLIL